MKKLPSLNWEEGGGSREQVGEGSTFRSIPGPFPGTKVTLQRSTAKKVQGTRLSLLPALVRVSFLWHQSHLHLPVHWCLSFLPFVLSVSFFLCCPTTTTRSQSKRKSKSQSQSQVVPSSRAGISITRAPLRLPDRALPRRWRLAREDKATQPAQIATLAHRSHLFFNLPTPPSCHSVITHFENFWKVQHRTRRPPPNFLLLLL